MFEYDVVTKIESMLLIFRFSILCAIQLAVSYDRSVPGSSPWDKHLQNKSLLFTAEGHLFCSFTTHEAQPSLLSAGWCRQHMPCNYPILVFSCPLQEREKTAATS